jgi:hypothetical protein
MLQRNVIRLALLCNPAPPRRPDILAQQAACHGGDKVEEGQYNIKFNKNYKLIAMTPRLSAPKTCSAVAL